MCDLVRYCETLPERRVRFVVADRTTSIFDHNHSRYVFPKIGSFHSKFQSVGDDIDWDRYAVGICLAKRVFCFIFEVLSWHWMSLIGVVFRWMPLACRPTLSQPLRFLDC